MSVQRRTQTSSRTLSAVTASVSTDNGNQASGASSSAANGG